MGALRAQVAPHFLFNSLNTLSWLIENNPGRALAFNQNLAEVYRYILMARRSELVPLSEEFNFLTQYFDLLKLRFEDSLLLQLPAHRTDHLYVPPISLQVLVENAVKHNEHSRRYPLEVVMTIDERSITVTNHKRPRTTILPSAGMGLKTLDERCQMLLGRGISVRDSDGIFSVEVPVRAS
jgi:LytS/YehU family sensor histidine kinase